MKPQQVTLAYTAPTPDFPGKLRPKPLEVVGTAPAAAPAAGTPALLAAGTDTTLRTWSAKMLVDFFAKKV